ncbi:MAG TPA: hypothetical protein VM940_07225 [Chthoniobacterales bacterium]|jgi:hypothetical protein|nr:hypothetical protein [Chthoniobacterales bacterium]
MNGQFEAWLQERFSGWLSARGQPVPTAALRISPALAPWEAYYFDLGLREDLFRVDEKQDVQGELLHGLMDGGAADVASYPLFSGGPPARLIRENVCQLAAASCLIYQRGWLREHVSLVPGKPEHHSTSAGFELLLRASGQALIWVEAKRSRAELEKLVSDLRACSRRGRHAQSDCGFPQNHPRYEFALSVRPQFLWAVAPDGDLSFAVQCEQGGLMLEPLESLPHRSRFEQG